MKEFIPILAKTRLFSGVSESEIETMLGCLGAKERAYNKGEYVLMQGESVSGIFVLAAGKLHICREDYWGNRSIINVISAGEMFGESYAAPGSGPVLNDIEAVESSIVISFDVERVLSVCSSACRFHSLTVQNLFFAISEKNRQLVRKLGFMSERTIREKLISYLSEQSERQGSDSFTIPFNRQQLADFLSVDRSALSAELSKMRSEGLIEYKRSEFRLLRGR